LPAQSGAATSEEHPPLSVEGMVEWTVESHKAYADPFNNIDVDVIFERDGQRWVVPAFWRGGNRWTVRFAPPIPGEYTYRLKSTDSANSDLKGREGRVEVVPYKGSNPLLKRGAVRVSANHRYFEQADGTPFFWLGDTWWSGLSDRLPWNGFQELTLDRSAKGFSVVLISAGLTSSNEETAPTDPGFCNEGGCAWEPGFKRINPKYFDYADRRIQFLLDHDLVPAIIGGWRQVLADMGVQKMKQHWRYVIARYGAYPVFWIAGNELFDPPAEIERKLEQTELFKLLKSPGWTEVARYIRATDPYHHPLSAGEIEPPFDSALQDESLTDFELFQPGNGWPGIATEIALLNKHYARTGVTKPLVIEEMGYEKMAGENFESYQRAAFWLGMLNGAAGFTYGTVSTALMYSADKRFHQSMLSPYTWEEAMRFPGGVQVGLAAKFLKKYPWWRMTPHPGWITPRGTTLLEPTDQVYGFNVDLIAAEGLRQPPAEVDLPLGEWHDVHGDWRLPYAAGVADEIRLIYLPYFGLSRPSPVPAVNKLEAAVRYHAFYWEPSLGIRYDLGFVEGAKTASTHVDKKYLDRKLYDAQGKYRGELSGPVWGRYGESAGVKGDTYQPERPPASGDWLLVLEAQPLMKPQSTSRVPQSGE
jgi:Protein of unknown function (DUF4038)/Domain of unknown function (DUF5060)